MALEFIEDFLDNYITQYAKDVQKDEFIQYGDAKVIYLMMTKEYVMEVDIIKDYTFDSYFCRSDDPDNTFFRTVEDNTYDDLCLELKNAVNVLQIRTFVDRYASQNKGRIELESFDYKEMKYVFTTSIFRLIVTIDINLVCCYELSNLAYGRTISHSIVNHTDLIKLLNELEVELGKIVNAKTHKI